RYRDLLFPAVFFGLAAVSEPRLLLGSRSWDLALDALGIAVALAGQGLRAAVIGYAYVRRGGRNKSIFADELVQEGFFAHSRNPLYLGNFLALAGFCLIHNSVLGYLVGIPFFAFAYLAIVAAEEDYLRARFGAAYDEYRRRVPRSLPSLAGLPETLSTLRFDWKRLVRKEYGSTFAGASCILALLLWEGYRQFGDPVLKSRALVLGVVWLPLLLAYLTARRLKKAGTLGAG
ncbi:MAG TPA: isoprenylcysteine carboxylmethyltransferase family protein, partial [Thermoanaerobaculia bacterium]